MRTGDSCILLTGASGLLGRIMRRRLVGLGRVVAACHARPAPGCTPLEITDRGSVRDLFAANRFTHVVNCAAIRSPDECLADPERAYRVNALGVEHLAAAAADQGACLVQVSTDYVFGGARPPYAESDLPDPVNLYGRTKLAGEHAARQAGRHLILRIPAQWRTDLTDERNFAAQLASALASGQTLTLDSETVRYYTLAEDVAGALGFLLAKGVEGVVHVSAEQKTSKADFARRLAARLGYPPERVQDGPPPAIGDVRPLDSHLSPAYYRSLGGPSFLDIDSALAVMEESA